MAGLEMNDLTKAPLLTAWPRMNQNIQSEKPATNPARNQYFLPTVSQLFSKLKIKIWVKRCSNHWNQEPKMYKSLTVFAGSPTEKTVTLKAKSPAWQKRHSWFQPLNDSTNPPLQSPPESHLPRSTLAFTMKACSRKTSGIWGNRSN